MATREWMREYLAVVSDQIRWKLARPVVLRELEDHLEDQCDAYLEEGLPQYEARKEALRQMGDPVCVGKELDAVHRPKNSWQILGVILALLAVNLILWQTAFNDGDTVHWLWIPLACMAAGLAALAVCYHLPWNRLVKHVGKLGVAGWNVLFVLQEMFFPNGRSNGRDYMILILPLVYGAVLYSLRNLGFRGLLLSCLLMAAMLWFCTAYWMSFLGMSILVLTGLTMTLLAIGQNVYGGRKAVKASVVVGGYLLMIVLFFQKFENIWSVDRWVVGDYYGSLFAEIRAHSRMFGPGEAFSVMVGEVEFALAPGKSMERLISECDYYLTSLMYKIGWLPAAALVVAVGALLVWCLRNGLKQPTLWGKFLTCAIVIPMLLQLVVHVVNNTVVFIASAQLPLLSYGNTYRILDLALLGVVLSVFRSQTILRDAPMKRKLA